MYGALAAFYDTLMADVPYGEWTDYVCGFLPAGRGADFGCGTGAFTVALNKRGYETVGVDISPQMLGLAQERAIREGVKALFVLSDMAKFDDSRPLDFIICMCDGVNYLPRPAQMFQNAYRLLRKGGRLVFDVSSEYKLKNILAGNNFFYDDGDLTYMWRNFPYKNRIDMELTFFQKTAGGFARTDETQTQYVHTAEALRTALLDTGFRVEVYGGMTVRPPRPKDERLHFVCEKAA